MISIEQVNKSYGTVSVLKDIHFQFEKGRIYGIVGKNGAGKTTLFNCIMGFESYEGIISSPWVPIKDHLGFLPTEPTFLSLLTGHEYLRLYCIARGKKYQKDERNNLFDLPLDRYASNYSTGMKKKLALTAILLQDSECYILDEPYNGVDIQSNIMISTLIQELKRKDKLILISSHIFSTLKETCDEILLLEDGQFQKSVLPEGFDALDQEMRSHLVNDKVQLFLNQSNFEES